MDAATLKKHAVNALFVVAVIAIANTLAKRAPVVGPMLDRVMRGL